MKIRIARADSPDAMLAHENCRMRVDVEVGAWRGGNLFHVLVWVHRWSRDEARRIALNSPVAQPRPGASSIGEVLLRCEGSGRGRS